MDGSLTDCMEAVVCRPGRPFYAEGRPDRITALFPVYLKGTSDDALMTAFAQARASLSYGLLCLWPWVSSQRPAMTGGNHRLGNNVAGMC